MAEAMPLRETLPDLVPLLSIDEKVQKDDGVEKSSRSVDGASETYIPETAKTESVFRMSWNEGCTSLYW